MLGSAKITKQFQDNSLLPSTNAGNVVAMAGRTYRGKLTPTLISSWNQFQQEYGGFNKSHSSYSFPLYVYRALKAGASVLVKRLVKWDDLTAENSTIATVATHTPVATSYAMLEMEVSTPVAGIQTVSLEYDLNGAIHVFEFTYDAVNDISFEDQLKNAVQAYNSGTLGTFPAYIKFMYHKNSDNKFTLYTFNLDIAALSVGSISIKQNVGSNSTPSITFTPDITGVAVSTDQQSGGYGNVAATSIGDWGNDVEYKIEAQAQNLKVSVRDLYESYELVLPFYPSKEDILQFNRESNLIKFNALEFNPNFNTLDLSSYTYADFQLDPEGLSVVGVTNGWVKLAGAVGDSSLIETDIIGNTISKNGIQKFSEFDNFTRLAIPEFYQPKVVKGATEYCETRKDCRFFYGLEPFLDAAGAVAANSLTTYNNWYATRLYGGLVVQHPAEGTEVEINPVGDFLGLAAAKDSSQGVWLSVAGEQRGTIRDVVGLKFDYGKPAYVGELDSLVNAFHIPVISKNGNIVFWGTKTTYNPTAGTSLFSENNIADFSIWLSKTLTAFAEKYIFEPNNTATWAALYREILPFLRTLVNAEAITADWEYEGDQNAETIAEAVYNDPVDVSNGIYKAKLITYPYSSLKQLVVIFGVGRPAVVTTA